MEDDCADERTYVPMKYYPNINPNSIIEVITDQNDVLMPEKSCDGVVISELYSYYVNDVSEQFIELYNPTLEQISLNNCSINYKNSIFPLDEKIEPGNYFVFKDRNLVLTKDPSNVNTVSITNRSHNIIAQVDYPHGQKKGTSYALFDIGSTNSFWRQTYHVTPRGANIYQEFQTCPSGKIINPKTGNCVKEETVKTEVITCPEGKYLNPLTNRCKTIESATTLTPCKEGYERNPETNRCRKIRENTGETTDYAPEPVEEKAYRNPKIFIAAIAIGIAVATGVSYVIYQYRQEIKKIIRNLYLKVRKV